MNNNASEGPADFMSLYAWLCFPLCVLKGNPLKNYELMQEAVINHFLFQPLNMQGKTKTKLEIVVASYSGTSAPCMK